jgi:hypothetical protein
MSRATGRESERAEFTPPSLVCDCEIGMEKKFFAVTADMVEPLNSIGIRVTDHVLYFTITPRGAFKIIPVRGPNSDGEQNEYNRTRELGLIQGMDEWVPLYSDQENRCYKVFPVPPKRYGEPQWPDLKPAKVFRLGFRDKRTPTLLILRRAPHQQGWRVVS